MNDQDAQNGVRDPPGGAPAGRPATEPERYQRLLENIGEAFYLLDREWRFTLVNRRAEELVGRPRSELIGRSIWQLYPMLRDTRLEQELRRAACEQVAVAFQWVSPVTGGWIDVRADPGPEGLSVYFRDVTAEKRAEASARVLADAGRVLSLSLDYEATLDELAHLVVPGFADWCAIDLVEEAPARPGGAAARELRRVSIVHSDPAKVELVRRLQSTRPVRFDAEHGMAPVLRTGEPDWSPHITDDMLARMSRGEPELLRILKELQLRSYIAVPLAARGRTFGAMTLVYAESGHIYGPGDVAVAVEIGRRAGTAVDNARLVASLRDSEARKGAILASALDCVITMDHRGIVLDFNSVAEETFGFAREEAIGRPVAELIIPPSLRQRHWEGLARYLQTGEAAVLGRRIEMIAVRAGGEEIPVELAISVVRLENQPPFFTAFLRDITARRQMERQREQVIEAERAAREQAERVGRMKDEFLATLSHELRTPLNAILGWSQLLRAGAATEEELEAGLETIERNARAQAKLIEDLLDMSRIVSGKLNLDVRAAWPADIVEAAVDSVRHAADAKDIRLAVTLDPAAGPVRGDPNRLQQVVWNLLSNAIKFTPKGGRVQVALERVNSHVAITVSDNGQGISPDFLPHVFDRFRQADAGTTRRHGGLGLGLSIVKQIVELHGGTVRAHSPGEGQGSSFVVDLPLPILHGPAIEPRAPGAAVEPGRDAGELRGVRVLVVDDEPDARDLLRRILERHQAQVTLASSADEALGLFHRDRPDLILSDIGMPETDGYELIRRVRALPASKGGRTPAVALTALARGEDRRRALVAGFQVHVAKPLEPAELIAAVSNLVNVSGRNHDK